MRAKFEMALAASQRWPQWLAQLNEFVEKEQPLQITYGTYVLLNSRNGGIDDDNFKAIEQALIQQQLAYQVANPAEIKGLMPVVDYRPLRALYLPQEGCLNPLLLLNRLEKYLQKRHCHLVPHRVLKLSRQAGGDFSLSLTNQEQITSKQTVIAAGAYSQRLVEQFPELRENIPLILSSVGCSMVLRTHAIQLNSVLRTPNRAGACGNHLVPYGKDLIYAGATGYFSYQPETQTRVRYLYNLQKNIIHQFNKNLENAKIEKILIGNRPVTVDGFPLIGGTSIPGLWLLTGSYRDGFHDSPLLGEYLAAQIVGDSAVLLDHPFSPIRHPLQMMSQQQSIDEAVHHTLATNYEYGMTVPINGVYMEETYAYGLTKRFQEIYDILEIDYSLAVEMLVLLLRTDRHTLLKFKELINSQL